MNHLFEDWETLQRKIQQAQHLFLLLDYDGTLTPIVPLPELALCPPEVKKRLEALRDLPGVHVAIISGRSLADLQKKVGVADIIYVGNHGLQIETPDGRHKERVSSSRTGELRRISQNVQNVLKEIPGILFEEKGPILSVHYRNVPQECSHQIRRAIEEELHLWKDRWRMASGKMVFEIQPNIDFHKGKAVKEVLKPFSRRGLLPIYLGDDQTDEEAFRALKSRGISVFVGSSHCATEADFFLRSPEEVQDFLSKCLEVKQVGRHSS